MDKLGIIFSLDEARCAGLTDAAVRHALACGRLVRVRRGMYCDAQRWGDAATRLVIRHALEARAAWLTIGRRGWACDYTATLLNGLPVPHGQPDRVTLSQATRAEGRRAYAPGLRLRTAMVDPVDIGFEWGMAVLRAARTALDVARNHGFAAGLPWLMRPWREIRRSSTT
ncbi:MAG: type IV toxin-antitoxin system AbiEi family antitoxin domain-containing protein [Jiangellaceae bacterium]